MPTRVGPRIGPPASPAASPAPEAWRLSDGEIHYLYWYMQGSIMDPDIRRRLRRAWGFCGRHAWGALAVETAFRPDFLHGPALLYRDLMGRAREAFRVTGPWQAARLARRLRPTGPCLMCEMGLYRASRGAAPEALLAQGRDLTPLRAFAAARRRFWWPTVCGRCRGDGSGPRCRAHLREEALAGRVAEPGPHRALVENIAGHLETYSRSFRWESRGIDTQADQAALLSAVGWCSGWQPWLPLLS